MQCEKPVPAGRKLPQGGVDGGVFALAWTQSIIPELRVVGKQLAGKGTWCHAIQGNE
jgi:hypothetical protein